MSQPSRFRFVSALLLLLVVTAAAWAQVATFDDATEVLVVEVPVYVTRDGAPVRGLTKESFEVFEGNKRLPIVGFEAVDLAAIEPGQFVTEVPVAARRHFLLLFDLVFADLESVVKAREAGLRLVREQLEPSDVAAVALYGAGGARLLINFTSDRAQLELALDTLGAPQLVELNPDPLALTLAAIAGGGIFDAPGAPGTGDPGGGQGLGAREAGQAQVVAHLMAISHRQREDERRQGADEVRSLSRSLGELARMLGSVDGRKYMVYFSEGYDSSLVVGDATRELADQASIEGGESWNVSSERLYGDGRLANDVEAMLEEFRRADFSVQAVDIAGITAGSDVRPRADGEAALLQMAKDTGGELFRDFNRVGEAMDQLMAKTSVVYLLTVQPQDVKHNGKFHRLKVKLAGAAAGADVHARPGFYAPDEKAQTSPMVPQLSAAEMILGGEEGGSLGADLLTAAFPVATGGPYVPVLVEIDGETLIEGVEGDKVMAELYVYAFTPDGRIAGYLTKNIGLDLAKVGGALRSSGIKYWGHLSLPPGDYSLRMFVRNPQTGRSRLTVRPLVVPDFSAQAKVFGPFFPEPQGKWLLLADPTPGQLDYPFMTDQRPFVPAARPQLPGRGDTPLVLAGWNLPEGAISATATLVDGGGKTVPGATMAFGARETVAKGGSRLAATLSTSGVPAGEYTLQVTVTTADGSAHQVSLPVSVAG